MLPQSTRDRRDARLAMKAIPRLTKHRDRLGIIVAVLTLAKQPVAKFSIQSEVGMTTKQRNFILEKLLSANLLCHCSPQFQTTEKGNEFIRKYNELIALLPSFSPWGDGHDEK